LYFVEIPKTGRAKIWFASEKGLGAGMRVKENGSKVGRQKSAIKIRQTWWLLE